MCFSAYQTSVILRASTLQIPSLPSRVSSMQQLYPADIKNRPTDIRSAWFVIGALRRIPGQPPTSSEVKQEGNLYQSTQKQVQPV